MDQAKFKIYKQGLLLIISLFITGCTSVGTKNSETKVEELYTGPIKGINGSAFLQPVDKKISLALAPTTYIKIDVLDSVYCNILYLGYRNLSTSRKYVVDSTGNFILTNPVNDEVRLYKLYAEKGVAYMLNKKGDKLFKVLHADTLNSYLNVDNSFKRSAFLYPSLDEKEQQYGAEDRYVKGKNGLLSSISHPLKSEVREINIFDFF